MRDSVFEKVIGFFYIQLIGIFIKNLPPVRFFFTIDFAVGNIVKNSAGA
mgnify:CR=1 FL=1